MIKTTLSVLSIQARILMAVVLILDAGVVPATSTLTYSVVHPFNYGVSTSYYQRVESTVPVTYFTAGLVCESLGAGWGLAGIYSAAATTSIVDSGILTNALGYSGYFGGVVPPDPSSKSANRFVFTYGRYKGLALSVGSGEAVTCSVPYCNYSPGEPNMIPCSNGYDGYQSANQMYPSGTWDDIEPTDCGVPFHNAAVCERATCAISLDCIEANTVSITPGLYVPNCVCICKTGFRGSKCQVVSASYFEDGREFAGWCGKDAFNATVAAKRCAAQGPEWTLPSITSATITTNLASRVNEVFWSSGEIDAVTMKHSWTKGRYDGRVFSSGLFPSNTPVMYTNWAANQPDHSTCGGYEPAESEVSVRADGLWNDLWPNGCGWLRSREVRCYACERSLCLLSDCPPRTSHVSGYFPRCMCQTETMTPTATFDVTDTSSLAVTDSASLVATASVSMSKSVSISPTQLTSTISSLSTDTATTTATASEVITASDTLSSSASFIATLSLSGTASGALTHSNLVTSTHTLAPTPSLSEAASATTSLEISGSLSQHTPSASVSQTLLATETLSSLMSASISPPKTITMSAKSTMSTPLTHSMPLSQSTTRSTSPSPTQTQAITHSASTSTSAFVSGSLSQLATPTFSIQSTPSKSHTLSLPPTATRSRTQSAPTPSAISTPTVPHTHTPTYAPNTTLINQLIRDLPLFDAVSVVEADVRIGKSTERAVLATALYDLLRVSATRRASLAIPIVTTRAILGPVGVTGNPGGFFKTTPVVDVVLWSPSNVTVALMSIASYTISVGEGVELYTSLRGLVGRDADLLRGSDYDADTPLLVGRILSVPDDEGESVPSIVTSVVTGGAGVAGGMAAELQGIGALAMMGCSDPNTKSSFGSYRVLSPLAVTDSYAGVIIGNAFLALVVGVIQACAVGVLRACQRVRRTVDVMAMARFPALLIAALLAFQTGTAYSSSQLISRAGDFEAWEVFVGVVGFAFSLLLPVFLALHPYVRIGRAYQEYDMSEWLVSSGLPTWVVWVIPRGAMFSEETRRAYGGYVSAYRASPRQVFWTSLPTWTPLVFLVAGLFHPNTVPGCQALFVCMGAVMVAMGVLVMWRAPLRTDLGGWLDATSRVLLGCTMFCMAAALVAHDSAKVVVPDVVFWLAIALMFCAILRVVHRGICWYADRRIREEGVPLSTVWTHIPGASHKVTQQFTTCGDALLDVEEHSRDRGMEVDVSDREMEDVVIVDAPELPSQEEDDTVLTPHRSDDSLPIEYSSSSTLGSSVDDATTSSDSTLVLTPTPHTPTPTTTASSHSSIAFSSSSSRSGSSLDLL